MLRYECYGDMANCQLRQPNGDIGFRGDIYDKIKSHSNSVKSAWVPQESNGAVRRDLLLQRGKGDRPGGGTGYDYN